VTLAEQPQPDVLWACVESGFHVGSRGGDFLGYVDQQHDGTYRAFDARSQPIGDFLSLRDATTAVSSARNAEATTDDVQGAIQ